MVTPTAKNVGGINISDKFITNVENANLIYAKNCWLNSELIVSVTTP